MTHFSTFSAYRAVRTMVADVPGEGNKSTIHDEREERVRDIEEVLWEMEFVVMYECVRWFRLWVVDGFAWEEEEGFDEGG